jgi:predicted ester cyclase
MAFTRQPHVRLLISRFLDMRSLAAAAAAEESSRRLAAAGRWIFPARIDGEAGLARLSGKPAEGGGVPWLLSRTTAIVRRFTERVWNDGDLSAIEDLVDDQFTNFGVRRPGGHAGMRHIVTAWRTAFPDLRFEIQEEIVHGDKVVHRGVLRGTHLGEFPPGVGPARIMGAMAPAGRSFEAGQIRIWRVEGGKIVEHPASRNDLPLLNQLGLVSGTRPVTEATWRKPVAPGAAPSR